MGEPGGCGAHVFTRFGGSNDQVKVWKLVGWVVGCFSCHAMTRVRNVGMKLVEDGGLTRWMTKNENWGKTGKTWWFHTGKWGKMRIQQRCGFVADLYQVSWLVTKPAVELMVATSMVWGDSEPTYSWGAFSSIRGFNHHRRDKHGFGHGILILLELIIRNSRPNPSSC